MKDRTLVLMFVDGKFFKNDVFYKDFPSFDSLPNAAKSEETKKEYEEFWKKLKEESL